MREADHRGSCPYHPHPVARRRLNTASALMKVLLALLFLFPINCFATSSPEEAARQYGEAVSADNWDLAVRSFRPADLQRIRSFFSKRMDQPGGDRLRETMFPGLSFADVSKISDVEYSAGVFSGYMAEMKRRGINMEIGVPTIVGTVSDGDTIAYVVSKTKGYVAGVAVETVDLTTVLFVDGVWYVTMPKEFENMVALAER